MNKTIEEYLSSTTLIDIKILKQYTQQGLPETVRSTVWKVLSGYLPVDISLHKSKQKVKKDEYIKLIQYHFNVSKNKYKKAWKSVVVQIKKDIPRTFLKPYQIFKNEQFRKIIGRIAIIWSFEHSDILFFQGLLDWIGLIIIPYLYEYVPFEQAHKIENLSDFTEKWLFQVETDCYFTLCHILDLYKPILENDFSRMFQAVEVIKNILQKHNQQLYNHMNSDDVYLMGIKSFICPFTRNFEFPELFRIFDALLTTDMYHAHFYFVTCLYIENEESIMKAEDNFEMIFTIQDLPTKDWNMHQTRVYLKTALQLYRKDWEERNVIGIQLNLFL